MRTNKEMEDIGQDWLDGFEDAHGGETCEAVRPPHDNRRHYSRRLRLSPPPAAARVQISRKLGLSLPHS